MTDKQQPEALRLADWLAGCGGVTVAAELRRQYAEIEALRAGYEAARLEIESLKAQLADHADDAKKDEHD